MQGRPNGRFQILKATLIGGVLAFGLLTITLALLGDPQFANNNKMVVPFVLVPAAGGLGGLIYKLINSLDFQTSQLSIFANFFSVLLYLFLVLIAFSLAVEI